MSIDGSPPWDPDGEHPDSPPFLQAYPFLFDRFTDQWFIEEYARLLPATELRGEADAPFAAVDKKFVIAFTARVGSTLLCQQLLRYGVVVDEFFNPLKLESGAHVQGASGPRALCRQLVADYAHKGTWGVKAHVQALVPLFMAGEFPERIRSWRFVYLTRDNVVRQAISLVIAHLSRSWATWEKPEREVSLDDYSYDLIARTIRSTRWSQASWEKFFGLSGIEPLRLSYETIVADPQSAAARVAAHCGLEPGGQELVAPFARSPLTPQATALNREWERRFREEAPSRGPYQDR